jgi:hypothetical protein
MARNQNFKCGDGKLQELARNIESRMNHLGYQAPLSHAYEILAASRGHRNWATMTALVERTKGPADNEKPQIYAAVADGWHLVLRSRWRGSQYTTLQLVDNEGCPQGGFFFDEQERRIDHNLLESPPNLVGFSKMTNFLRDQAVTITIKTRDLGFIVDTRGVPHDLDNLPDDMWVRGDLVLVDVPLKALPNGLHVENSLVVDCSIVRSLPSGLDIGTLALMWDDGEVLSTANDLKVRGNCISMRSVSKVDPSWISAGNVNPLTRFKLNQGTFTARELFGVGAEELSRIQALVA